MTSTTVLAAGTSIFETGILSFTFIVGIITDEGSKIFFT